MTTRRKAREVALQILYKADISGRTEPFDYSAEMDALKQGTDARAYCETIVAGALARTPELDAVIEGCASRWKVSRMTVVDRNILRLAVFELAHAPDVPYKVVIDEAVELAKRYGTEDSPAFINGILDQVHRELDGASASGPALKK